ncbi:hypothetical protein ACU4GD_38220 [Cupriavidus basilensis]
MRFDADEAIGSIVITGSERAFAAGADIGMMAKYSYMDVYKGDYITRNWGGYPPRPQAGDRGGSGIRAGRRLRTGHDVRHHHRGR